MTKESFVLYWFMVNEVIYWSQMVVSGKIIYAFRYNGKVWHLEYDPEEIEPGLECDVRSRGNIVYFGTVEDCLKMIKRAK